MESVSVFDDLPDLALIELFTYLSSFDALWSFSRINYRLTILLAERGFLRRLNLSPARFGQFNILFDLFTLKDIQSLAIDCDGSPLQLIRWPRLPQLRTLRIKGVCNVGDLKIFLLVHAATLTHLILESNQDDMMVSQSIEFYNKNQANFISLNDCLLLLVWFFQRYFACRNRLDRFNWNYFSFSI